MQTNSIPLYKNPVALDQKKHSNLFLVPKIDYSFAQEDLLIPILLSELRSAVKHFPIVFTTSVPSCLVAVMGIANRKNQFIENGEWKVGTYMPQYLKRYPFLIIKNANVNPAVNILGIDLKEPNVISNNLLESNYANPLFIENKPTEITNSALKYCLSFQNGFNKTKKFVQAIEELQMIVPKKISLKKNNGEIEQMHGLQFLNDKKIFQLPEETYNLLNKKGFLHYISLIHASQQNWQTLLNQVKD
ncbi:SapC family protein [Thorsellia kenyensis]|uniref:SapC family protein n=1 Tax=Thorsellia kenyensis TaxID=1549888 RepID=A0ABV6CBH1_9GAMM